MRPGGQKDPFPVAARFVPLLQGQSSALSSSDLALLDFKQPIPKSGEIELDFVVERYFLATAQIG